MIARVEGSKKESLHFDGTFIAPGLQLKRIQNNLALRNLNYDDTKT